MFSATQGLRGDLIEEVAYHGGLAQRLFEGQVHVLLQVTEGKIGVSSAKFVLILLMVGERRWRGLLAFLRAQAELSG